MGKRSRTTVKKDKYLGDQLLYVTVSFPVEEGRRHIRTTCHADDLDQTVAKLKRIFTHGRSEDTKTHPVDAGDRNGAQGSGQDKGKAKTARHHRKGSRRKDKAA